MMFRSYDNVDSSCDFPMIVCIACMMELYDFVRDSVDGEEFSKLKS